MDLFSGCGGMSLGATQAGCEIVSAVELDPHAAASHGLNFHPGSNSHAVARNISETDPHTLLREQGIADRGPMRAVDLLVGGPPCQAFARVGRAKLREIREDPEAFLHDTRSGLYRDYLRFVERLAPAALVVENVPDVLNYGGHNVFETMAQALDVIGYECRYGLINAVHYGVPQMRTRAILIGVARVATDTTPTMPPPTHRHELPLGYRGTRNVALRHRGDPSSSCHYIEAPQPTADLPPAITAHQAIADLPRLVEHLRGESRKRSQRLDKPLASPCPQVVSDYAMLMRTWPGHKSPGSVYDHVIRALPRDYRIFRRMRPGDQYPEAHAIAYQLFEAALEAAVGSAENVQHARMKADYVPPYDPGKFPNKWRKMEAYEPARTLTAHIGKDTYSHIHYDSRQARTISVREAARLQSFPDGFRFHGSMNTAFKQIGNAVPPLLARAVVSETLNALGIGRHAAASK